MPCFRRSRSRPDIRLPTVIVLAGPNGAGKTALLRALVATAQFAAYSYGQCPSKDIPGFVPFLAPETRSAPTRIEIEFDTLWLRSDSEEADSRIRYTLELVRENKSSIMPNRVHSELSSEILGWFRNEKTNLNSAQLICSLHNLAVLDDLEKEEVFIVEKDQEGVTHVHRARDVTGLRRDDNLQKQYRSGVIGGMPTFG